VDTLLRNLAVNRDVPGWEETATNWLIASVVIAVSVALIMIFVKVMRKKAASGPKELTWKLRETNLFMFLGLLPIAAIVAAVWYLSINFHSITGTSGLFKGIAIGWFLYFVCMLAAHAALWRNDLY
jgi:multisubunit Na+/H+ antiporter MnhB subunit